MYRGDQGRGNERSWRNEEGEERDRDYNESRRGKERKRHERSRSRSSSRDKHRRRHNHKRRHSSSSSSSSASDSCEKASFKRTSNSNVDLHRNTENKYDYGGYKLPSGIFEKDSEQMRYSSGVNMEAPSRSSMASSNEVEYGSNPGGSSQYYYGNDLNSSSSGISMKLNVPMKEQPGVAPPKAPTFPKAVTPKIGSVFVRPTKLISPMVSTLPLISPKVASIFGDDDDDDEPEEMPPECKMRMKNVGRDTPTSAGPNSFGKTKIGFCNVSHIAEKKLEGSLATKKK